MEINEMPCVISKVKKEGLNKYRLFFCCPNNKENSCRFFDCVPNDPCLSSHQAVNFPGQAREKPNEHYLSTEFIDNFANEITYKPIFY